MNCINKFIYFHQTSTTANLDYEAQDTYEITILVMDNGSPPMSMQKTFTMKVINENEAPTLIYLSNDKVCIYTFNMKVTNENEAPTLIYLSNDKVYIYTLNII